jgi:uncharacterized protein
VIDRTSYIEKITQNLKTFKVCALLGPRQCGKTTIATHYANLCKEKGEKVHFFDLEDHDHLNALENAKLVFQRLSGLIIIDEIQRIPELFTVIRVMVDHYDKKFLILGSASQELIRQSSETLAGRIIYNEVHPFRFNETHGMNQLWFRGGFPLSYLSESEQSAQKWLKAYVKTFLEKDIPSFGFDINPSLIRRFWTMLCGYHGNIFNASELGQSLDLNHKTTRRYLDILTGTFMMRTLQPWHANIQKRQVKQPKVYFRDSGIFHVLMGVKTSEDLLLNAKLGASWEGFAMEEIISELKAEPEDCFFWATHGGAEIDLLINTPTGLNAYEFKFSNQPKITKSIQEAINTLALEKVSIVVPGNMDYPLSDQVWVIGLEKLLEHQQ